MTDADPLVRAEQLQERLEQAAQGKVYIKPDDATLLRDLLAEVRDLRANQKALTQLAAGQTAKLATAVTDHEAALDYLRAVAAALGLPREAVEIASCQHVLIDQAKALHQAVIVTQQAVEAAEAHREALEAENRDLRASQERENHDTAAVLEMSSGDCVVGSDGADDSRADSRLVRGQAAEAEATNDGCDPTRRELAAEAHREAQAARVKELEAAVALHWEQGNHQEKARIAAEAKVLELEAEAETEEGAHALTAHELAKVRANVQELRFDREAQITVLRTLVEKLRSVEADPRYEAVWTLYAVHGGRYQGPFYKNELKAAEKALSVHPTTQDQG